jgi:AraC-like DNA-binding protein
MFASWVARLSRSVAVLRRVAFDFGRIARRCGYDEFAVSCSILRNSREYHCYRGGARLSRNSRFNTARRHVSEQSAYGQAHGSRFRQEATRAIVTRVLRKTEIAVTEVRGDDPETFTSGSIPYEDAFLVAVMARAYPHHEYWEGGKQAELTDLAAGDTVLYDLKRDPVVLIDKPFHSLHFYLPRIALNAIADDANVSRVTELDYTPGAGVRDPSMTNLGMSMLAALDRPEQASRVFVDHVTLAVAAHVAHTYGGMRQVARPMQGGLAPWQERRAKELLHANLHGDVSLKEIARECGLSISHFTRAFRQTTGLAPHRWLVGRRIEQAKALLRGRRFLLSEIALRCGFADQSHFTRTFTAIVGVSPGAWRRQVQQ